jgi:FMN phosphatase YigB (HAD superfamily)
VSKRLLVCDLDNTLYDWVGYFVPSFYAMVDEVVRITGCDRERLLDDFQDVHRTHQDSEHPFALLETRTVKELFPDRSPSEIANALDSAFHAFNASRKANLKLYPGVRTALHTLSEAGVVLVAHTESKVHAVVDRLTRLELTRYFRHVYCRERTQVEHPSADSRGTWLSRFPMERVSELSRHQRKPDPKVLIEICGHEDIAPEETAYVGDSLVRDVFLAKCAGVFAIWAKYGAAHATHEYQQLVRITHWTADDVAREQELSERARDVKPDYVLERSFQEILAAVLPGKVSSTEVRDRDAF